MAAKSQDKLISLIRSECAKAPERAHGYREELLRAIADVVSAEKEHALRATDIQKQVTGICERLGDFITGPQDLPNRARKAR